MADESATSIHARTCHLCEANCGVLVEVQGRTVVSIRGNPDHVLSRGHICPKATALADLQDDPDRLRRPVKRVGDSWQEISWDTAFAEIGARMAEVMAGGGQPAMYMGNPNAHNYATGTQTGVLRKAMKLRTLYSASTLDQIPHQLIQMWMYGHNALFPIPDVDRTRFMLIIGGNPLASNGSVWTVPDVKKRLKAVQKRGGQVVVIDPRRTETAKIADAHHFIRPGTDIALLLALLKALDEAGLVKPGRLEPMLDEGWAAAWAAIRGFDVARLAGHCGIAEPVIRDLAATLGSGEPAIVYGRMGVSVTEAGTLNLWLIQLLNIATGNLDREGGVMFSSPVVDLVAGAGPGTYDRFRSRIGDRPEVISEFPSALLPQEIATPGDGQIRALVVLSGNPVLSAPGAWGEALPLLDLMVSVDMYVTATSAHAHYILPPCGPLEKDHYPLLLGPIAIRNYADYSAATLPMEEGAKADWEIVAEMARAILHARGEAVPNIVPPRTVLASMLARSDYDVTLEELEANPNGRDFGPHVQRLPERLQTPDKRIACAPALCLEALEQWRKALAETPADSLLLIGRRHVRNNNSWLHNSPRLAKGPDRCTAMIHPDDAVAHGVTDGDLVRITSRVGSVEVAAEISEDVMPGVISIPHGFGHDKPGTRLSVAGRRPGVSLNDLTDPQAMDPISGNAVLNGTPVTLERVREAVAAE
ncbi:molybdopterin oxidoreductase family protein [Blastomonas fulva]|uniref:molybdopterin oxidoreductase family protein n=1 Tax=Blastomonas fulva TaxID=1550728 RepID=UPI0025A4B248|nr:molybdopterin oxidoreductase family protein [Blastomonas fulva]MDM7927040.1 molybdopterin oxidoreductase family protein [Blastomonas fulva]MDM7967709.1 molybdopterin oxidoreductase family protein [Blastomonas fulva]